MRRERDQMGIIPYRGKFRGIKILHGSVDRQIAKLKSPSNFLDIIMGPHAH